MNRPNRRTLYFVEFAFGLLLCSFIRFITSARRYCDPSCWLVGWSVGSFVRVFVNTCWCRISWKRLGTEAWFQWTTNEKWRMADRMITWSMTSRDPERSRSWPPFVWGFFISKKIGDRNSVTMEHLWEMHLGYQMVTCPMTSRDPTAGAPDH